MILFNKYKITEHLTTGNYGSVYKGENIRTKEKIAVKVEKKINQKTPLLKREMQIYLCLGNLKGFTEVKWFGSDADNTYLIMGLLGDSLTTLKTKYGNCSAIVNKIGVQMIHRIETLHSKGLIHRDIKPSNFLLDLNNSSDHLHLIDFGFSKRYKLTNGQHIPFKRTSDIIGTVNFISLNVHQRIEPSRRDDIESIIYILIYLLDEMDWESTDILKIIECKQNIGNVIPKFLKNMLEYVRSLNFDQDIDYLFLNRCLTCW